MTPCKKPIRRSMLVIGLTFITLLVLLISGLTAVTLRTSLARRYDAHLKDVVAYVEGGLDLEDLRECIETGVPSEKFDELQQEVNIMVDDFELVYLYICIPVDDGQGTMLYVVASTSEAERAAGDTEDWPLMYVDRGYFTAEDIAIYLDAWSKSPELSIFNSKDVLGAYRTVCKPLVTADGETLALLCADIEVGSVRRQVNIYTGYGIGMILFIAVAFSVGVGVWLRKAVTEPLGALEQRARGFAEKSHGKKDPALLTFDAPEMNVRNDIWRLSNAIKAMSGSMRDYVDRVLAAEKRAETAEEEVEGMTKVAYEDTLTGVKSKVAYDAKKAELTQVIADGSARFALVMIDLNNLKQINDTFGLEKGNRYVVNGSNIIKAVYKDCPIYRIGGDEFVVILEGDAYWNREELLELLNEKFWGYGMDENREPWENCTAAAGMTEYLEESDKDVDQVYRRAEKIMTRNKRMMKSELN